MSQPWTRGEHYCSKLWWSGEILEETFLPNRLSWIDECVNRFPLADVHSVWIMDIPSW